MDKSSFTANIQSPQILDVVQIVKGFLDGHEAVNRLDIASALTLKDKDIAVLELDGGVVLASVALALDFRNRMKCQVL
jgi:hypothetical protein